MNELHSTATSIGESSVRLEMEATVIRADGTVEPLGVVSSNRWGPLSPHKFLAWWRITRVNRRHQRRMGKEA